MRKLLLVGLLAGVVLPLSIHAQDFQGPELFPITLNARWTYRIQGQEDRFTVWAAAREKVGETNCFRLEARLRTQLVATEHLSIRKDGVYRHRSDANDIVEPALICKFPPLKGETWTIEYKIVDKKARIAYDVDEEEITVPAGKYKTLVIRSASADTSIKLKNTCWYAPKVGLVKQMIEDDDGKIILELDKFERNPKIPVFKMPN